MSNGLFLHNMKREFSTAAVFQVQAGMRGVRFVKSSCSIYRALVRPFKRPSTSMANGEALGRWIEF